MADQPYARVYYSVRDDPKFVRVYSDDRLLATWLRLLIEADGLYPAPASIPRSAQPAALRVLVEVGLVDLCGADLYRIHGLASERSRRNAAARSRWNAPASSARNADASSGRIATASSEVMLAEPSLAEPRRDEPKETPPPPTPWGRRKDGTNQRATGTAPRDTGAAPRQAGTSIRQERQARKTGPTRIGEILRRANQEGKA